MLRAIGRSETLRLARVGAAAGRQPVHARLAGAMYQQHCWHEQMFDTVEAPRKLADEAGPNDPTMSSISGSA